ncbi:hypothetical protein A3Q56_00810 [Intoshia linei]|uniref:Protein kinase domain-containing protein n=1 Tax=Intoshia linei TaxID=1819745 RepID=A0A177BAR5_9BILA|nr:hypothetical protein A3Q56_00810 [Intoshia linei]
MRDYCLLKKIGEGSFGTVYKAKNSDQNIFALKILIKNKHFKNFGYREIDILIKLQSLRHPNIVKSLFLIIIQLFKIKNSFSLYEVLDERYNHKQRIVLVLDYMDSDLSNYIKFAYPLSFETIRIITVQILEGVKCLHQNDIIHRDIKSHNILIRYNDLIVKITDFGLSKVVTTPNSILSRMIVTLEYRAPEIFLTPNYNEKVDIWSIGCILIELINGKKLFKGRNELDIMKDIIKKIGYPEIENWPKSSSISINTFSNITCDGINSYINIREPDLMNLIPHILCFNPDKRMSCNAILSHSFLVQWSVRDYITKLYKFHMIRHKHNLNFKENWASSGFQNKQVTNDEHTQQENETHINVIN